MKLMKTIQLQQTRKGGLYRRIDTLRPATLPVLPGLSGSSGGFRVLSITIFFGCFLSIGSLRAQNDLANPTSNIVTIPSGSIVIPMDSLNYYGTTTKLFNLNTYGLIFTILNNSIAIHWFIKAGKSKDGIDFTSSLQQFLPTSGSTSSKNLRAGPMVIYPSDTTGVWTIINNFNTSVASSTTALTKTKVNVYRTTSSVSADLRYILTEIPTIAVLNDGGFASIETQYFVDASVPSGNYSTISGHSLMSGCYTVATQPHNTTAVAANLDSIQSFLNQGGNFFAQCRGLLNYENFTPSGGTPGFFQTTEGITIDNKNTTLSYPNPDVAFNQFLGSFDATTIGGGEQTWLLSPASGSTPASAFKNNGYITVSNGTPTTGSLKYQHLSATAAKLLSNSVAGGMMFYAGGHNFSASSGTDFTNGERMYFNAVLTPCGTRSFCRSLFFDIDMSVTQTVSATKCYGDTITLSLKVKHNGPSTNSATGVVVTDTIPAGLTYISYTSTAGTYNSSTGKWTLSSMSFNDSETLTIKVLGLTTTSKKLTASVKGSQYDRTSTNDTSSVYTTVNPLPSALTISNSSICIGSSISIGATSVSGHTYAWVSSPSGFSSTSSNPTVSPTITTTYTLTETNTSTGCSNSNAVTITVNALPAATTIANTSICSGSSISIGAAATTGSTYSWSSIPSGFSSTTANPTVTPSVNTIYTLTETNSNGCVNSNSVNITVNTLPAAATISATSICSGNSLSIGATAVSGSSYSWSSSPAGFSSTSSNPTVSPVTTTIYTLTETNSTGCVNSNSVTVTVKPLPAANIGSNSSICTGQSASIGAIAVAGSSYVWSSIPSGFISTSSNATVTPVFTTTYTLTETGANGCVNSNGVTVTVNPYPAANAGSNATICQLQNVTIGGTAISGSTYSWSSSPAGFSSAISDPTVNPTTTTTYTVTETNTAGCSKSNSVIVTVNPLPDPAISGNTVPCEFVNGDIYFSTNHPGNNYLWSVTGGTIQSGQGSNSISVNWGSSGTGLLTLIETNPSSGCSKTVTFNVTIYSRPGAKSIVHN
jgi:uncharacterized repeat protein (TIGR01451 family)